MRAFERWRVRSALQAIGDERGVAALEAGLAMPLVLALGFGTIEFGNVLYRYALIQTGVRDAARYLARTPVPSDAETAARQLAITGKVTTGGTPRVPWWKPTDISISYRTIDNPYDAATGTRPYRAGPTLTVVRVSTTVDYGGLGMLGLVGLGSIRLSAAHEERFVGD